MMGMITLTSCEKESDPMTTSNDMSIAQYASSDGNFSILVQALSKANLVNALKR